MQRRPIRLGAVGVIAMASVGVSAMAASALFTGDALAASPLAQAGSYTPARRVYKSGDTNRYQLAARIKASGPMGDQDIVVKLKYRETVKEAKPSGEWSLLQEFEAGTATIGGQDQDVIAVLPVVTISRDAADKVTVKTEGGTPDGATELGGMLLQISTAIRDLAPDRAAKPGDKWKASFTNPNKIIGGSKVEVEAELLEPERVESIKTVKIRFKGTSQEGADGEKAPIEGTINIEPDTGRLVRITEKGAGSFAGGKAKAEVEVSLVTKEEKPPKP